MTRTESITTTTIFTNLRSNPITDTDFAMLETELTHLCDQIRELLREGFTIKEQNLPSTVKIVMAKRHCQRADENQSVDENTLTADELMLQLKVDYNPAVLLTPIEKLEISVRCYGFLKRNGILYILGLVQLSKNGLKSLPNPGWSQKHVCEITECLETIIPGGMKLGMIIPEPVLEWCEAYKQLLP